MEFNIRLLSEDDYDNILVKWWKDWRWEPVPKDALPGNGTYGYMVSKDGIDICAGFLYTSNSSMAMCEFIVSNFEYKNKDRKDAIVFLIDALCNAAKLQGFKYVWTCLKNPSLIKSYEANNFSKSSPNCLEMIKIL
jgi:hypothetical protein